MTRQHSLEKIGQLLIEKLQGQRASAAADEQRLSPVQRPSASTQAIATIPKGRIAYVGTDKQVHVTNTDGSGDTTFPTRGPASSPRWSPTSGKIVYGEELGSSPYRNQIVVLDPASRVSRVLVAPEVRSGDALHPPVEYWRYDSICWTPDGSAVVYKKASASRFNHAFMRVAAEDGSPQQVAGFSFLSAASVFDISPTGGRMAMTENGLDAQMGSSRLVVARPDGSDAREVLSLGGTYLYRPVWTHDGQAIGVAQQRDNQADWTLFLINPDTGAQRVLGNVPTGSSYTFSPDGEWMVLSTGDTTQLLLVNLANFADQRYLGNGAMPAWELTPRPVPPPTPTPAPPPTATPAPAPAEGGYDYAPEHAGKVGECRLTDSTGEYFVVVRGARALRFCQDWLARYPTYRFFGEAHLLTTLWEDAGARSSIWVGSVHRTPIDGTRWIVPEAQRIWNLP